jgi:DnaJ-class molecular chaperone
MNPDFESNNYYDILGVSFESTQKEIKKSFRSLTLKYHPDKNNDSTQDIYSKISKAYKVLSNEKERKIYDKKIKDIQEATNPFEVFDEQFKQDDSTPNIYVDVMMNIKDLFYGVDKTINYSRYSKCRKCNMTGTKDKIIADCKTCQGRGRILEIIHLDNEDIPYKIKEEICHICNGIGINPEIELCGNCEGYKFITEEIEKTVTIPAGAYQNYELIIENEGNYDPDNKKRSDVICIINENNDNYDNYSRGIIIKNNVSMADVVLEIEIDFDESIRGINRELEYFDDYIYVKSDDVIMNGDIYVLKKYGMEDISDSDRKYGDLFIKFQVKKPKLTSKQKKKILKTLNSISNVHDKYDDCDELIFIEDF